MTITAHLIVDSRFGGTVVITVWIDTGAGGTGMVTTIGWDGRLCWVSRLVLLADVGSASCGASVTSLVRGTNSVCVLYMMSCETSTGT